jgi:hypothetical protein
LLPAFPVKLPLNTPHNFDCRATLSILCEKLHKMLLLFS